MNVAKPHVVTVIQARRGSTRLPDKVMMPILGKPLLVRMIERVQAAQHAGTIVVATTTDAPDDIIQSLCEEIQVPCYRGNPTDLLDRHYQVAVDYKADIVVKIPSDVPLIDPAVIDRVLGFYIAHASEYDFVSNLHPATYPDGNDVEAMSFNTIETAWKEATLPMEREHTTPYIWENPERFRLYNFTWETGLDYSMSHRFTIDYREDYEFIKAVYEALFLNNPQFSLSDILNLLEKQPEIFEINSKFAGVNWYRNHLGELKTISNAQTRQL